MIGRIDEQSTRHLDNLNTPQLEAASHTDGPILVLAGAGTGKTKVLTSRIANLISMRKAFPSQILAVTFTNKAAKEMKNRVEEHIGVDSGGLWLGTFHSIAAKILRRHGELIGFTSDFIIIDYDDQIRLLKQIINDYNIDEKKNPAKLLHFLISRMKDKAILPKASDISFANGKGESLYAEYEKRLLALNAVDFGGLLLHNITLFNTHLDVLEEYQNKLKYILVDEYQDTNVAQYVWLRQLAQLNQNICCVGDDDQSIYGWRGAEVTNILRFDKDFQNARVIRLEQNYRSSNHILAAASSLIANNHDRHGKVLWTDNPSGHQIKLSSFYDEREEARFIAEEVESARRMHNQKFSSIAILVRAGYQTRVFEDTFNYLKIPYRIVGGLKFYERAEIKDVIAYIRLTVNTNDSLAFERVINQPKRGIGNTTLQHLHEFANNNGVSLFAAAEHCIKHDIIKGKTQEAMAKFLSNVYSWQKELSIISHQSILELALIESGYLAMWENEKTEESRDRLDNIKELIKSLGDFSSLKDFLEHVSLVSDVDSMSDDDKVNVLTMHSAKGLEFETVFLPGWEEGIFPSNKSIDENGKKGLEEERRLAYVGITRAKQNLYISFAMNRRIYGSYQNSTPSRFIDELPTENYELVHNYGNYYRKVANQPTMKQILHIEKAIKHDAVDMTKLRRGSRVSHTKFGKGIVVNIQDNFAEVAFERHSLKKVMIEYLELG